MNNAKLHPKLRSFILVLCLLSMLFNARPLMAQAPSETSTPTATPIESIVPTATPTSSYTVTPTVTSAPPSTAAPTKTPTPKVTKTPSITAILETQTITKVPDTPTETPVVSPSLTPPPENSHGNIPVLAFVLGGAGFAVLFVTMVLFLRGRRNILKTDEK